jgi:hypothetical protein
VPPFDSDTGYLPGGEHEATWAEVVQAFGWNASRRAQLDGLFDAICLLADAGCRRIWLNGSFVTSKDEPGDFDAVWEHDGVNEDLIDPIFFELDESRKSQKARFGGELFPNWRNLSSDSLFSEFFQQDRIGRRKGIVVLDPQEVRK